MHFFSLSEQGAQNLNSEYVVRAGVRQQPHSFEVGSACFARLWLLSCSWQNLGGTVADALLTLIGDALTDAPLLTLTGDLPSVASAGLALGEGLVAGRATLATAAFGSMGPGDALLPQHMQRFSLAEQAWHRLNSAWFVTTWTPHEAQAQERGATFGRRLFEAWAGHQTCSDSGSGGARELFSPFFGRARAPRGLLGFRAASSAVGTVLLLVQPQRCIVSSSVPGRLLSAFRGNHSSTRSAGSTISPEARPTSEATPWTAILQMQRCQKAMMTDVQMGSSFQQSLISESSWSLSSLSELKEPAELMTALAAVAQLQLALCARISLSTSATSASPTWARSSSGLWSTSTRSPIFTISLSLLSNCSPRMIRSRVSRAM
mmetsp:Transcript_40429/g.108456  ORF Transcript_40429/g.108456 Transcript_40429/m.108456 type:complete len:376 (+) Transcript_40429:100-1227(+)